MTDTRRLARSAAGSVLIGATLLVGATAGDSTAADTTPGGVSGGLVLWLDASDPNGDGTTPAEGSEVTLWADKSGTGNEATVNPNGLGTPNTGAYFEAAPTGFNGVPALRFDRDDDDSGSVYQTADLDIRASSRPDLTVFSVYMPRTQSTNNGVWGVDDGDWDRFFLSYIPYFGDGIDDGLVSLGPTLAGETVADAGTADAPHLMTVGYSGNVVEGVNQGEADASYVYFNCALERSFTDSTDAFDARTTLSVGWDGDNSVFDGHIAEVIVYDRALTVPELEAVNTYLATKYGLEAGCAEFDSGTDTTIPGSTTT